MKKRKTLLQIVVVGLCLAFAGGSLFAQTRIEAQGVATIHNNMVDVARDKAIDNAQREAVEKAVGVMVSSFTEVENYQVKIDQILSESRGFINTYKVLDEKREDNQYRVTIEADVSVNRLKDKLEAVNLILSRKSRPRLMVLIVQGEKRDEVAESAMIKHFLAQGFKLVETKDVNRELGRYNLTVVADDAAAASKLGSRYGAEVLVVGRTEASTSRFTVNGVEMRFNKVDLSARAVKVDTAEVIATDSEIQSGPGMEDALKSMTVEASGKLARKLTDQLVNRWSYELTNTTTIKLIASGLRSYRDLVKFKELITNEVKGVKEVNQREYRNGHVEIDLEVRGNVHGVADDIAALRINGKAVRVQGISQNTIKVRVGP
ncbi:MAG TPA: flagellar assembly protein T N-terminal domain-containing protein [Syntrophales bacterium]|nr:flagellar assembly protein T N-terminal domain-containing protein [Syntrophales bacterium]HRT26593.1 flagellar assembly protein T N-terminal domain-containing protein [Syntrophales bacterium]HRT70855.1 flagellar assembly protein T N-terminal domain-containing protein [Syntrophales bacterium]